VTIDLKIPTNKEPLLHALATPSKPQASDVWYRYFMSLIAGDAPTTPGTTIALVESVLQSYGLIDGPAIVVASKTTNYTLLRSDSGTQFDDNGAAGAVNFTLPAWAAGPTYSFVVATGGTLTVLPAGTDKIVISGAVASTVFSNTLYSYLRIVTSNIAARWIVAEQQGTWGHT
jgi:hypothetical protein